MGDFYIFSLKHTNRKDPWITFWRPENKGYAWPLEWSGKYTASEIDGDPGYYNDGVDTIAVPVVNVESLKIEAEVDRQTVFCLPNKKAVRTALIAARKQP
jgi:hypothetical protein